MTLIEAINAKNALKNYFDKTPPGATMYKIIKFIKYAEEQGKCFEDIYARLVNEHGERDNEGKLVMTGDGKGYRIKQESVAKFIAALSELENTEVEIKPSLSMAELSPLGIKMSDMYHISPIIKEE